MEQPLKKIKVLFLSAWYPSKVDPMLGLFVERHARAVAAKCDTAVLYVQPRQPATSDKFETEIKKDQYLVQVIVYYNNFHVKFPLLTLLVKTCRYLKAYRIGFKEIKKQFGDYDIIHVNILMRTGFIALLKKIFSRKPYIITEHWSRYLPLTSTYHGVLRKLLTRIVVKNASAVTTVSYDLKNAMIKHNLINKNFTVVSNVVDTDKFTIVEKKVTTIKSIIHVSCFEDRSKNISGMLRVLKNVSKKRNDFACWMVGDGMDKTEMEKYTMELGLLNKIVFLPGLKENNELIEYYQKADFMLMFSNYENMPVVIPEAFACGLPVIATEVGGIPEVVNESNGLLVKPKDEIALENAIDKMLDTYKTYNKLTLRNFALLNFSKQVISESFFKIYEQILE